MLNTSMWGSLHVDSVRSFMSKESLIIINNSNIHFQSIPDTLLGAVLGYAASARIPKKEGTADDRLYGTYPFVMNAISISFDNVGFGTTLARTFNWVRLL